MKLFKTTVIGIFILAAGAFAQTLDLGQNFFFNDQGQITMVVHTGVAVLKLDSPYVMFQAFLFTKTDRNIEVGRDDIFMEYNGQQYKMPTFEEWRKNYNDERNDVQIYNRLGKDALMTSELRNYRFPTKFEFFPLLGRNTARTDYGSFAGMIGFMSTLYFKNPGFKKGDKATFFVKDAKNREITGTCTIVLE